MAAPSEFGLHGLEQVFANLDRIVKKVETEAAQRALDEQGDRLVADIVAGTPVVSGAAAGSVRKRAAATSTSVEVEAGGSPAPYFPVIEWGGAHNHQPAAPFRRALEQRRLKATGEMAASIRKTVPELQG